MPDVTTQLIPGPRHRDLFLAALEKTDPRERAAFLEAACGADTALRQKVDDLFREQEAMGGFLENPAVAGAANAATTAGESAQTEKPGDRIGRYKILQKIGEGGCGVVHMAEQEEPVRRRVAVKVIKLGMDTRSVIARFEAERQALAMMDHPNIAKVFDAGATETGRPFFVMELVRGIKFTEYCDQNQLPTRERLRLFIQVCQAIQHAHQKGIIHRDIKPSNILITLHDSVPVPKVIDFGIAKATDQRLTDKTLFTEFQLFIGTPAYTSPEQAEMSGLDIDTRSDIYSLGVLLYEILTGQTPFDAGKLINSGLHEMRRIIREDEPLLPSTRLSTLAVDASTAVSRSRREKIPALVETMRGDLDWIVMKCLDKDRTRRYATANDLASDVQRYLDCEPVLARPPSTLYRMRKFARRYRAGFSAAAGIAAALIVGAIISTWLAVRATRAEQTALNSQKQEASLRVQAERERARAELEKSSARINEYIADINLAQQSLVAGNSGRVVDLLNRLRPKSGEPELRQWEWRHLWSQSQSEAAFAFPRQSGPITSVAISRNGRYLVSRTHQGALRLWDLFRRVTIATLQERGFGPGAYAFSQSSDRLAASVSDGPRRTVIKVWSTETRAISSEISIEGGALAIAFAPDDRRLLIVGLDLGIRVWEFKTQQMSYLPIARPPTETFQRRVVLFSPDTRRLAIGDQEGHVRIIDLSTGDEVSHATAFEEGIASLAFSPNGETLAIGAYYTQTTIKLFSTAKGTEVGQLIGHASWVPGLVFTADGQRLISAGADQTVRIWDVPERRERTALRGHLSEVNCVAVTPDGKTVVSGCKDGTMLVWDGERSDRETTFETLPTRVSHIEFFPDSQKMLSLNVDGTVSLWNASTLQQIERISALGSSISRLLLSADGSRVFTAGRKGPIQVFDWASRTVITNLSGFRDEGVPLGLTDGGRTLVAAMGRSAIGLWDTRTWSQLTSWKPVEHQVWFRSQTILSRDERHILMPDRDGAIEIRDVHSGRTEGALNGGTWTSSGMAFSPDGSLLAVSSPDGTVTLWDFSTRKIVSVLRGHLLGVHAVAFSPDGSRIASGSHGNEAVKLWDVRTGQEVATLRGHGSQFSVVRFSPDGRLLVAINAQGEFHLWRAPSLSEIAAAEARPAPELPAQ